MAKDPVKVNVLKQQGVCGRICPGWKMQVLSEWIQSIVGQWDLPLNGKGIVNSIGRVNVFDLAQYTRLVPVPIQVEVDKTVTKVCLQTSVEYVLYFDMGP